MCFYFYYLLGWIVLDYLPNNSNIYKSGYVLCEYDC